MVAWPGAAAGDTCELRQTHQLDSGWVANGVREGKRSEGPPAFSLGHLGGGMPLLRGGGGVFGGGNGVLPLWDLRRLCHAQVDPLPWERAAGEGSSLGGPMRWGGGAWGLCHIGVFKWGDRMKPLKHRV